MSYSNPQNLPCHEVNMPLWEVFHNVYKSVNGVRPYTFQLWTEEEVVQWLDTYQDEPDTTDTCDNDEQAWVDYQESVADYYSSLEMDDGA